MKLNLAIVREDLKDLRFHARCKQQKLCCTLDYAAEPVPDEVLEQNIAYVVTAKSLAQMPQAAFEKSPSIICIGKPHRDYLDSPTCNVIWTDEDVSAALLIRLVQERFVVYDRWILSLQSAVAQNAPLKTLATLSNDIFRKPMWVYDKHYQTIFGYYDESHYTMPEDYVFHEDHTPWAPWELNSWKEDGFVAVEEITSRKDPYVLPSTPLIPYRALGYNIFIGDEYAAAVTIDEIGSEITDRDHVLLKRFGDIFAQGLMRTTFINLSATSETLEDIRKLLNLEQVSESRLIKTLASIGWHTNSSFVCAVALPASRYYSKDMIQAVATKTCSSLKGVIYLMDEKEIVFVINERFVEENPLEIADIIFRALRQNDYQTLMGVSTQFPRITDLYHYRRQAHEAVEIGTQIRPITRDDEKSACYYFEDYMLDFIINKCSTRVLPETLCPPGLACLLEYDRDNGTDLCTTLKTYLENNMQIAESSRQLFMHRNSLINRLRKIDSIILSDLSDPDTRLLYQMSFKILESKEQTPPPRISSDRHDEQPLMRGKSGWTRLVALSPLQFNETAASRDLVIPERRRLPFSHGAPPAPQQLRAIS